MELGRRQQQTHTRVLLAALVVPAMLGVGLYFQQRGGDAEPALIDASSFAKSLSGALACPTTVGFHPVYGPGAGEPSPEQAMTRWMQDNPDFDLSGLGAPSVFDRAERLVGYTLSSSDGARVAVTVGRTGGGWVIDSVEACEEVVRP